MSFSTRQPLPHMNGLVKYWMLNLFCRWGYLRLTAGPSLSMAWNTCGPLQTSAMPGFASSKWLKHQLKRVIRFPRVLGALSAGGSVHKHYEGTKAYRFEELMRIHTWSTIWKNSSIILPRWVIPCTVSSVCDITGIPRLLLESHLISEVMVISQRSLGSHMHPLHFYFYFSENV